MPQIPRYYSQEPLNKSRIGAPASPGIASMPGEAFSQAGSQLFQVGRAFEEAQAWQQKQQSKLTLYEKQNDILTRSGQDPDIDNPEVAKKYKDELNALSSISDSIYNPRARAEFGYDLEVANIKAGAEIDSAARKMIISKGIVTLNTGLDKGKELYATAQTAKAREDLVLYADQGIDEATRLGYMTPEEGYARKAKNRKEWSASAVTVLIAKDPDEAIGQITSGAFPDLTADQQAKFLSVAEAAKKSNITKQENALKMKQDQGALVMADNVVAGTWTIADVYNAMANQDVKPADGMNALKWINSASNPNRPTDRKTFIDIANKLGNPDETRAGISKAILSQPDGISDKDARLFLDTMKTNFEGAESIKNDKGRRYWSGAWSFVKEWSKQIATIKNPNDAAYQVGQELLDAINNKNLPPEQFLPTAKEIVKSYTGLLYPKVELSEKRPTDIMSRAQGTAQVGELGEGKADVKVNAPKKVKGVESGLWYDPQNEQIIYRDTNGKREYRVVPKQEKAAK